MNISANVNANRSDSSPDKINDRTPEYPTVDENFFEYYEKDSPSLSRPQSIPEEYVLANPSEQSNPNDSHDRNPITRRAKPIIQDEYDEDHYTLARPSMGENDAVIQAKNIDDKPRGHFTFTKNKKILGFFAVLLVVCVIIGVVFYATLDSCIYGKNDIFSVSFRNSDKYPIDIMQYDHNWNEETIKLKIDPGQEFPYEAYFSQNFFFKRSNSDKRLKASSNGMTSEVFEGCRFEAKAGRLIYVEISNEESKETKSQDTTPIATTSQRPSPQKTTFETISQVTTGLKTTTIPQDCTPSLCCPSSTNPIWEESWRFGLTEYQQAHWEVLGWDQESWDNDKYNAAKQAVCYSALNTTQLNSVKSLCYDQNKWDHYMLNQYSLSCSCKTKIAERRCKMINCQAWCLHQKGTPGYSVCGYSSGYKGTYYSIARDSAPLPWKIIKELGKTPHGLYCKYNTKEGCDNGAVNICLNEGNINSLGCYGTYVTNNKSNQLQWNWSSWDGIVRCTNME